MKKVLNLSIFSLVLSFLFVACQKENVDSIVAGPAQYKVDTVDVNPILNQMKTYSNDTIFIDCIRIPFPVKFELASGTIATANDTADLNALSLQPDSIMDFHYPFQAYGPNGAFMVNDISDIIVGLTGCHTTVVTCADLDAHVLLFFNGLNILTINKYEYTINYPVTIMVEGNPVVLTKDDDYLPAIGGSPFSYKQTDLVYPISISQFGRTLTFTSDNDVCAFYETLNESCGNKPAHIEFFFNEGAGTPINCTYFINYPVNVSDGNGNILKMQSRADYIAALNASPNAYGSFQLVYPVSANKYSNNQNITFTSDADICQYLNNCR